MLYCPIALCGRVGVKDGNLHVRLGEQMEQASNQQQEQQITEAPSRDGNRLDAWRCKRKADTQSDSVSWFPYFSSFFFSSCPQFSSLLPLILAFLDALLITRFSRIEDLVVAHTFFFFSLDRDPRTTRYEDHRTGILVARRHDTFATTTHTYTTSYPRESTKSQKEKEVRTFNCRKGKTAIAQ